MSDLFTNKNRNVIYTMIATILIFTIIPSNIIYAQNQTNTGNKTSTSAAEFGGLTASNTTAAEVALFGKILKGASDAVKVVDHESRNAIALADPLSRNVTMLVQEGFDTPQNGKLFLQLHKDVLTAGNVTLSPKLAAELNSTSKEMTKNNPNGGFAELANLVGKEVNKENATPGDPVCARDVGSALTGATAGAVAGSAVPVIGTAAGAIGGALIGLFGHHHHHC
jgi:hypothetical protein